MTQEYIGGGSSSAQVVLTAYNFSLAPLLPEDTCSCPTINTNWAVDMSDNCVISDNCEIGTGNISYSDSGTFSCDANINCSNSGDPGAGNIIYINDECVWNI